jgi:hypothetical protein
MPLARNLKQGPKCSSKNAMPIVYGFPAPGLFEKAEEGKVRLGGCCVGENDPEFYCKDCEYEWNKEHAVYKAYQQIKGIKAFVGGHCGESYLVVINLLDRKVSWIQWEQGEEIDTYQKTIRVETAERFIDQLKSVNLLGWKYKYEGLEVCDGTGWTVDIIREGRNLVKSGSNAFPKEWDSFCSIMKKVVGREFS